MNKPTLQPFVFEAFEQSGQSKADILRALGYSPKKWDKARQRLDHALHDPFLGIGSGGYDFLYSDEEFLRKLLAHLDIQIEDDTLNAFIGDGCRFATLPASFLRVKTDFVRRGQSFISMFALQGRLQISIPKHWVFFDADTIKQEVRSLAEKHHQDHSGRLMFWGNILGYEHHGWDGSVTHISKH